MQFRKTFAKISRTIAQLAGPVIVASLVTLLWLLCRENGWHFEEQHNELLAVMAGTYTVIFAVPFGLFIAEGLGHYKAVRNAAFEEDLLEFLKVSGDTLPRKVYVALGSFAVPPLAATFFAGYPTVNLGVFCVFCAFVVVGVGFGVLYELQNPHVAMWFYIDVPVEWAQYGDNVKRKEKLRELRRRRIAEEAEEIY